MKARRITAALFAVLSLSFGAVACSDAGMAPTVVTQDDPDNGLVKRLVSLGFDQRDIEDRGSYYVVEGDIEVSKEALRSTATTAIPSPRYQWRTPSVVASPSAITVDLRGLSAYPAWASAVRQAMAYWSAVGGQSVRFTEVTTTAQITFSPYSSPCSGSTCTLAISSFPTNFGAGYGNPGPTVRVNVGFNWGNGSGGQPTDASKLFNMVHELGHNLGFRHSNWQGATLCGGAEAQSGAVQVPGTPEQDAASVMNGCAANNEWNGFSYWDRMSARKVYGMAIPVTASIESTHPKLSWQSVEDATSYKVYLYDGHDLAFSHTDLLTSTTATSYTDAAATASGPGPCGYFSGGVYYMPSYIYYVTAVYPDGSESPMGGTCFSDFSRGFFP
jgi:hypothetical protein